MFVLGRWKRNIISYRVWLVLFLLQTVSDSSFLLFRCDLHIFLLMLYLFHWVGSLVIMIRMISWCWWCWWWWG